MAGQIVHIELKSADFDRAAGFYATLFGWQTQEVPEMGYLMFTAPGGPGGGFTRPETSQAPGCLAYIAVDDVEAKLSEIEKAGGRTILGRMPVSGMGELAVFADPDGNTLGLWKETKPAAAAGRVEEAPSRSAARGGSATAKATPPAARPAGRETAKPQGKPAKVVAKPKAKAKPAKKRR